MADKKNHEASEEVEVTVTVPVGHAGGHTFSATFNGASYDVEVPPGVSEGDEISFNVMSPKPQRVTQPAGALMEEWFYTHMDSAGNVQDALQLAGRIYGKLNVPDATFFITSFVPDNGQHADHVVTSSGTVYRLGSEAPELREWLLCPTSGGIFGRIYGRENDAQGMQLTDGDAYTTDAPDRHPINPQTLEDFRTHKYVVASSGSVYRLGWEAPHIEDWLYLETGQLAGRVSGHASFPDGDVAFTSCVPDNQRFDGCVQTASGSIYRQGTPAACLEEWSCDEATWRFSGGVYGSSQGVEDGTQVTTSPVPFGARYDGFIQIDDRTIYKLGSPCAGQHNSQSEPKFAIRELVLGAAEEAALGLKEMLGLDNAYLSEALADAVRSVSSEFAAHGSADDLENLAYVLEGVAGDEASLPSRVKRDVSNGFYHGGPIAPGEYDDGHDGYRLEDFCALEPAQIAKLSRAEVLTLRLYTTSSFRCFNNALRTRMKPHPFAASVYFLYEGIRKLRSVTAHLDPSAMQATEWLYRGMANTRVPEDFAKFGGCELAPMSTSTSLAVALNYSRSTCPLVFKYRCVGMMRGASLQFLSVYPKEQEYLFPPLTFLVLENKDAKPERLDDGTTVFTVMPQIS